MTESGGKKGTAERIVVKVGSSLLTASDSRLDAGFIERLVEQICSERAAGRQLLLVTSGAVAAGMSVLGWRQRPQSAVDFHVAAAVGQLGMYAAYQQALARHGCKPAQLLLSAEELSGRSTYLNSRAIIRNLFALGILPVVNENDAVAMSQRRLGDNDRLAAVLANLIEADLLVIMTDVDGLYDQGRVGDDASLIRRMQVSGDEDMSVHAAGESASRLGSGGMRGKLAAVAIAARGGTDTMIVNGGRERSLARALAGEGIGTFFAAAASARSARKLWILERAAVRGRLRLDQGAVRAICSQGGSLLPVGVKEVSGDFQRGDSVECVDEDDRVVARGVVNYGAKDAGRLVRVRSDAIAATLGGHAAEPEIIHRDNLALLQESRPEKGGSRAPGKSRQTD